DIDWALAFNAKTAVGCDGEAILQRLFQPLVHTREKLLFRLFSHYRVGTREQAPWRINPEQRHGVITLFAKLRRQNTVVGQSMAIYFAWRSIWQPALQRLLVAKSHLVVAFVTMKSPAECFPRGIFLCLQLGQPLQEHVDFKDGTLIGCIRLIWTFRKLRQHVSAKVHQ